LSNELNIKRPIAGAPLLTEAKDRDLPEIDIEEYAKPMRRDIPNLYKNNWHPTWDQE